jgi:glycosyltransferase involved in cell wall biosynthesis
VTQVAIIIVSYNTREDLSRCLDSLHASPPATTYEIVVVDNGSTDGSSDTVRTFPNVRLIESGGNVGFARANNIGIRATMSVNLLLLNSDTIVPAGAIDRLLAELDANPDVAVVGPRIVDGQGRAELSFGRMMGPFNEFRQKRLGRGPVDELTHRRGYPDWVSRRPFRRALFHVHRGRRLLRRHPRSRAQGPVLTRHRNRASPWPIGCNRARPDKCRVPPQPDRVLSEAQPEVGAFPAPVSVVARGK